MEENRQFQNLDLLKLLMRGNNRGATDHRPESITRTPTPSSDIGSLRFSGFGPAPCLDLKPVAATETATDKPLLGSSPAPSPYQLHTSPSPPGLPYTHRPLSSISADSPRYSTLENISRFPDKTLPIYDNFSGPRPSSSNYNDPTAQQLRGGLKALFRASTPLDTKSGRALEARTALVAPLADHERESVSWSLLDILERKAKFQAATSEPVGGANATATAHYAPRQTISPLIFELDSTEAVFMPAELDGSTPVSIPTELDDTETTPKVAEVNSGTEEAIKLDNPEEQGELSSQEDE
ncbi:hypothetical protein PG995_010670 [Apiospora arundinis]